MKTRLLPLFFALVPLMPAAAAPASAWNDKIDQGNRPVVTVNGEGITLQQLYDVVMRRYGQSTLSEMMQRLLVEQAARKAGVSVTPEEIEARYQEVRQPIIAEAKRQADAKHLDPKTVDPEAIFNEWVTRTYLSPEEFRLQLRSNLLADKVVRRTITVKDEDLTSYKARVITFLYEKHSTAEATALAEDVCKKAAAGEDFAVLARKYSEDELAKTGGELPEMHSGDLYLPIELKAATVVLKQKAGQVSPVIQGELGCYVIKVESIQQAPEIDAARRDKLRERMLQERVKESLNPWLEQLKKSAKIELKDQRFK